MNWHRRIETLMVCLMALAFAVAAKSAAATTLINCARDEIRISLHDRRSGVALIGESVRILIRPNNSRSFDLPPGLHLLKVFSGGDDLGRLVYLWPHIDAEVETYTAHMTGAFVFVRSGGDCASAKLLSARGVDQPEPAEVDIPVATHMVHSGIWVSGAEIWFRIRAFDGERFELLLNGSGRSALAPAVRSGSDAWLTYHLVGRNRYRDALGNIFIVDREFRAEWNGIEHRYSWLE